MSPSRDRLPTLGRHSPRLKSFRELRAAGARRQAGACIIEGAHLFERIIGDLDAGKQLPYVPRQFILSEAYLARFHEQGLDRACRRLNVEGGVVSESVMRQLSDTESPQGVMAELSLPNDARDLSALALATGKRRSVRMVLAEGVSDPGNLGTLARAAAGLGADLFLAHGGADPFGPKALRATAGAFAAIPYGEVCEPERLLKSLSAIGVTLVASVPRGGRSPIGLTPPRRFILTLGSEAHGLPSGWVRHADLRLRIPLGRDVESLNVAVAGSILLYLLVSARAPAAR